MGKKYQQVAGLVDKNKLYLLDEATELVKKTATAKFDETVEITLRLGVDPKQAGHNIRGSVVLPQGLGKKHKICVITKGDKLKEAEEAGADFFGAEELVDKIAGGWLDFDVLLSTPDMMKNLGKLGKQLGPRGLMPNPKTGTLTMDIKRTVEEVKKGRVEYKVDSYGIIHTIVGKVSFPTPALLENIKTLFEAIMAAKPAQLKGQYLKGIVLSCTYGPGIKVDSQSLIKEVSQ